MHDCATPRDACAEHAQQPKQTAGSSHYDRRVPPESPFISYAQNREDVVLWRALGGLTVGRYVEVGANHPRDDSVTKAFYDRGWSGITIEPVRESAEAHRAERPRDTMVEAVITDADIDAVVLHEIAGTGLSTIVDSVGAQHRATGAVVVDKSVPALRLSDVLEQHGGTDQEVHFMLVDTEGAEQQVLASVDLRTFRPWILVVESTTPNSVLQTHHTWEPALLEAGYVFCLFDGISRFYVAQERAQMLEVALSYPACVLDRFVEARAYAVWQEREGLIEDVRRWRAEALTRWAEAARTSADELRAREGELAAALRELDAMHATVSWRVTRPLRAVRRRMGRL